MILFVSLRLCDPSAQSDFFKKILVPDWLCGGLIHLDISLMDYRSILTVGLSLSVSKYYQRTLAGSADSSNIPVVICLVKCKCKYCAMNSVYNTGDQLSCLSSLAV